MFGSRTIAILRPGPTATGAPSVVMTGTPAAFKLAVSAVFPVVSRDDASYTSCHVEP